MLDISGPAKVTIRDMQWLGDGPGGIGITTAVNISAADQTGGRIQIVGSRPGAIRVRHLEKTRLSLQANPHIASISLDDVAAAVAIGTGPLGPVDLSTGSRLLVADTWYEGPDTALFRMTNSTFTYLGGHMAPATHPGAADLNQPSVLLDPSTGSAVWIGMEFDLSAIPSGIGIQIEGQNQGSQAYFIGLTSNKAGYFDWAGANPDQGAIGFILNRTVQGNQNVPAPDQGSSSPDDIRKAWAQARSLTWDTRPYEPPAGSTDIRIYHMKMDQTGGLTIGN
jgi:hypothetical protein